MPGVPFRAPDEWDVAFHRWISDRSKGPFPSLPASYAADSVGAIGSLRAPLTGQAWEFTPIVIHEDQGRPPWFTEAVL